jgi:outer membrane protein assembly factor BamB
MAMNCWSKRMALLAALLILANLAFAASSWPRFRGPNATGVLEDPTLPDTWSATENVIWRTEIPGSGLSSPVVWGDKIFLTAAKRADAAYVADRSLWSGTLDQTPPKDEHYWMVYCLDANTGKILWEHEVHRGVPLTSHHPKNTYASATPVTDGERVFAYFGNVGVFAFNMQGKPLWSKKIGPFETRHGWGMATSPVLHGNRLFILCDNDDQSFLAAFDKNTGEQLWRVERDEKSTWSTPFIWENELRTELVTSGAIRMRSYDLDGKLLWEIGGPMSTLAIPSPFANDGLLYLTSGYVGDDARPVYAVKPGASGDITLQPDQDSNKYIAWHLPQGGPYNPSPLVYGGYFYTLFDRGFLTCHDAKTGKEVYGKVRLDEAGRRFTASPWAYNGKIFALSEEGDTLVIKAGPEYELLHINSLDEPALATPAIAAGSLFIRTAAALYRIGKNN